ncbi:MAG: hypothetical protein ABW063_03845 [Caulobacter sp.]
MRRKTEWVPPIVVQVAISPTRIEALDQLCEESGVKRAAWVRACVYRVMDRAPTFPKEGVHALIHIRQELRRIGVATRMLASRAHAAGASERVVDDAWKLHAEVRKQLLAVRAAVAGNLAYWDSGDE